MAFYCYDSFCTKVINADRDDNSPVHIFYLCRKKKKKEMVGHENKHFLGDMSWEKLMTPYHSTTVLDFEDFALIMIFSKY